MGVVVVGESPSLTVEFIGETHWFLKSTQTHLPGNQHQKGPFYLWVAEEVTESHTEPSKQHCSLLDPYPTDSVPQCRDVGYLTLANPKALLLTM